LNTFRWIIAIPLPFIGWYLALIVGAFSYGFLINICPNDKVVSGLCVADWYKYIENAHMVIFISLAAILVVLLPSSIVPNYKEVVAKYIFLSGAFVAIYMAYSTSSWGLLPWAIFSGLITVIVINKHVSKTS